MKKGYSGSPSKKPRSSSSGKSSSFSTGKSFFKGGSRSSVKTDRPSTQGSSLKDRIKQKKASSFVKPGNDPGEKIRNESYVENGSEPVQGTGGGGGCCSGITGLISLFAILAAVVLIVFLVKCL